MDVSFLAYATDCIVSGTVNLREPRFSDMLVDREVLTIKDVALDSLEDGHRVRVPVLDLMWSELLFAVAAGPRGAACLRPARSRTYPVRAAVGPYEIVGYLHTASGTDPVASARNRRIIALTDASVTINLPSGRVTHHHDAILLRHAFRSALESVPDATIQHVRGEGRYQLLPLRTLATG